jgi:type I restriction enzyme, S subunit
MTGFPAGIGYTPLKHICKVNEVTLPEDTPEDLEIEYIDISAVDGVGAISKPELTTFKAAPSRARRVVRSGDVLISTVRTYLKAIAHVPQAQDNLICSTGFAVLTAGSTVVPRFLFYWISSEPFVGAVVSRSVGVSYPAINPTELTSLPFPQWPRSTQAAIAELLDRELARIDTLIAKKQRLIELLDEKRAAVISHVVTQGLNPDAPMKETGIEWLGRVPAHWRIVALKWVAKTQSGGTPLTTDESLFDGNIPWLRTLDLTNGPIEEAAIFISQTALNAIAGSILPPESVLAEVRHD